MKKLLFTIVSIALFAGCDLICSAPEMDSKSAVRLVRKTVEENVDFDSNRLLSVQWTERDTLTNRIGRIDIEILNAGDGVWLQSFTVEEGKVIAGEVTREKNELTYPFALTGSIKLDDLDPEAIVDVIEQGKSNLPVTNKFLAMKYFKKALLMSSGKTGNTFSILSAKSSLAPEQAAHNFEESIFMK